MGILGLDLQIKRRLAGWHWANRPVLGLLFLTACGSTAEAPLAPAEPKVIVRKPFPGELEQLGIQDWPIWTREPGRLPWTYEDNETCYILEGEVTVEAAGQQISFSAGDLVLLPQGLACVWQIQKTVKKHYRFGPFPIPAEPPAQLEKKAAAEAHPPGWETWDENKRKEWLKAVDWARHVTAVRAEEAHQGVDFISHSLRFVDRATLRGADPKLVLEAFLKALDSGKTPQEELRNLGVTVSLDP